MDGVPFLATDMVYLQSRSIHESLIKKLQSINTEHLVHLGGRSVYKVVNFLSRSLLLRFTGFIVIVIGVMCIFNDKIEFIRRFEMAHLI